MKPVPLLVLVAAGLVVWLGVKRGVEREAVLREKISVLTDQKRARESVIAALVRQVPRVDTVRKVDAASARSWAARYQRLRDSVSLGGDIPPLSPIGVVLAAADSTVRACTRALASCDSAIALRDAIISQKDTVLWATDSLLRLERKRRNGFRVLGIPLGCVAGGVGSARGVGAGVGCGIRF